ncbi:MAG: capping complex subunit for YIEGIA [Limnochordia bacterium]
MDVDLKRSIMAVVTMHSDRVSGGAPIFLARDQTELEAMAAAIARVMAGMVHEVSEGTLMIVKH